MTYGPARLTLGADTPLRTSDAAAYRKHQERYTRHGGGSVQASFHSVMRESHQIDYSTADLRRLLTVCTAPDAPSGASAIEAIWSRPADNTIPYATALSRGFAYTARHFVNSISLSAGDVVRASVTAFGLSPDGTTSPTTEGTPTPPPHLDEVEEWVCASVSQGANQITKWENIEITIEHGATTQAAECFNGQLPYPLLVVSGGTRGGVNISMTITGHVLETEINTTQPIVIVLRPKQRNAPALGTDEITLTLVPGLCDKELTDGSPSTASLTVLCRDDGNNRPLTITLPA
jgi:hypothetical protein